MAVQTWQEKSSNGKQKKEKKKKKKEATISIISTSKGWLKTFTVPSAPAQVYFLLTEEMQDHWIFIIYWIYILPFVQELKVACPRALSSNFSLEQHHRVLGRTQSERWAQSHQGAYAAEKWSLLSSSNTFTTTSPLSCKPDLSSGPIDGLESSSNSNSGQKEGRKGEASHNCTSARRVDMSLLKGWGGKEESGHLYPICSLVKLASPRGTMRIGPSPACGQVHLFFFFLSFDWSLSSQNSREPLLLSPL